MPKAHSDVVADAQLVALTRAALKRSHDLLEETAPLVRDVDMPRPDLEDAEAQREVPENKTAPENGQA